MGDFAGGGGFPAQMHGLWAPGDGRTEDGGKKCQKPEKHLLPNRHFGGVPGSRGGDPVIWKGGEIPGISVGADETVWERAFRGAV